MVLGDAAAAWPSGNVPDPCRPLSVSLRLDRGRRWAEQSERRARILAAARLLMTRRSFEEVHLQAVARHCDVAIQTIYNLVGNRAALMGASAEEWVASIAEAARAEAARRDLNASFTTLTMFWSSAFTRAAYVESAVRTSEMESAPLRRPFQRAGIAEFTSDLTGLRRRGLLRETTDISSLARQLTIAAYSTICTWVFERYDADGFRSDLVNGPGMMLAAALLGEEQRRLERGIAEIGG